MTEKTTLRSDQVRQPLVNTTAYWDDHATFIPKKGEIVVYSDGGSYEENGQDVPVPKIKIGDGVTSVWLLHFTDDDKKGAGEHEVVYAECTLVPDIGITCNMSTSEIVELVEAGKVVLIKYGHDIYHITSYNPSKDPNVRGLSCINETVKWIFSESHAGHKLWRTGELSIPTVNDATLTIKKNGTTIDTFSANSDTDKTIDIKVPTNAADVSALPSSTKYAASLYLSVNSLTYVVTAQLKDQDGNNIGAAQTIDLPLESVVVDGSYNPQTKKVVLTLENGSTIEFSVADLVAGLQSEITPENPLSADLVVDGNVNKVFTLTMRNKLDGIEEGAEKNVQADWDQNDSDADDFIKHKPTIPTVNDAALTIQADGVTVNTFTANDNTPKSINFESGTGVDLSVNENNKTIKISAESHHTVISKNVIVTAANNSKLYYCRVRCDLNGSELKVADISDTVSASNTYSYENNYIWTKQASETGRYLGICKIQSIEGRFVFKIDIHNAVKDTTVSHYFCLLADAPTDSTFTFVTTCDWEIIVRTDPSKFRLLAYMKVPDSFDGTITLTPLRKKVTAGNIEQISSFDYSSGTTIRDYYWYNLLPGGSQILDTLTELAGYTPNTDNPNNIHYLRTPAGNYYVNVIGDFGGNLAVGSKISDALVNDYFLHTLERRIGIVQEENANVQADWAETDETDPSFIQNKPQIPTVNNATLTIKKNGTTIDTFSANSDTDKTIDINGLQEEITPQNPLSADLVVDGTGNKVMTAAERAKLEGIAPGAEPNAGEVVYAECDLEEGIIKCGLPPVEILERINHGDCVMMLFESQVFHMAFAKKDTHPVVYGFTYDNARTLKRIYYDKDDDVKTQWFIEKIAIPVVPTNVSAFNNDMGYITGDDVPIEVISFYWSLTNTNYTSTLGPDVILHALEAGLCVIGLEKDSKDPTKTTVYQCMKYTHDEQKETYTLVFANVLNNEIQYFKYSSTSAKWTLSLVALQQKLYGNSGAGQNLKTINNTTLLGSGNINIHEGDDNVQSDWSQDDPNADDYIKNKPDITDEKITPEADNTSTEYPVILANAAIPSNGKPKYSSGLKATGTGDMIFEKDNTRCRIHYDDTDVSLKFMFE